MGNEAAACLSMGEAAPAHVYETIETRETIAARIEHVTAAGINQLTLVIITLFFNVDSKTSSSHLRASMSYFLDNLRPLVRKTDVVFLLDTTLHFLLLGANHQGGEIVQSRLWDALLWRIHNTIDREIIRPLEITIGHSAYPSPCQSITECIVAAREVNLSSNFSATLPTRKSAGRQTHNAQQPATEDEWPALARKLGIPYLSLLPKKPSMRVQQLVNARLAHELHCYPVGRERNMLTVAMLNPQDREALQRLQQETGLSIFPVLTHPKELQIALEQLI
ncbi:MAG: hypothetical protein E6I91_20575 [Chloroflexi bacterium]|nr:MAG: hypothetical protein E6I91_20575 [Chloroflexota bacterium]